MYSNKTCLLFSKSGALELSNKAFHMRDTEDMNRHIRNGRNEALVVVVYTFEEICVIFVFTTTTRTTSTSTTVTTLIMMMVMTMMMAMAMLMTKCFRWNIIGIRATAHQTMFHFYGQINMTSCRKFVVCTLTIGPFASRDSWELIYLYILYIIFSFMTMKRYSFCFNCARPTTPKDGARVS